MKSPVIKVLNRISEARGMAGWEMLTWLFVAFTAVMLIATLVSPPGR